MALSLRLIIGAAAFAPWIVWAQGSEFLGPVDSLPQNPPAVSFGTETQNEVEQLDDGSLEDENVEAGDLERIAETRSYYRSRPIDLNAASGELLDDLNLLSPRAGREHSALSRTDR